MGKWKEWAQEEEDKAYAAWLRTPAVMAVGREKSYARALAETKITPEMSYRQMLAILQARLQQSAVWYYEIHRSGGPTKGRLDGYISGVLAGYAMRVDPRVRAILLAWDHEGVDIVTWKLGEVPPSPLKYHPGKPPPHKRRRAARERSAAAAAREAAERQG